MVFKVLAVHSVLVLLKDPVLTKRNLRRKWTQSPQVYG